MTLTPDKTSSRRRVPLYEEVADTLRQKIYDYALPPGDWIDEPALAQELGISRTPLRESLKLLAAEGLVQIEPGRGARVTRLTLEDLNELSPIMAMLKAAAPSKPCARSTPMAWPGWNRCTRPWKRPPSAATWPSSTATTP